MEITTDIALYWAVFGLTLIFAELILPGLVVVFLGIAALLVSLGIYMGWINSVVEMMLYWFVVSIFLIVTLRELFAKFAPGTVSKESIDEDAHAVGQTVKVEKTVDHSSTNGRVHFRGSTWNAQNVELSEIEEGDQAEIVEVKGLVLMVKPFKP